MKKYIKSIALFLSLLMLFNCFSIISFAEENETQVDNSITAPAEEPVKEWHLVDEQEITTGELIGEVEELISLREENIKHFRLSDGTYEAVVYNEPIHRKDENGVWQDIDNTIELKTDANISKYTTQDSRVSFADRFKADSDLFTLSENGYSISMQLLNGGNELDNEIGTTDFVAFDTPTVNNSPSERTETKFNSLEEAKSINNTSSIVYNNIKKNTNIEYILNGNNVKENIIITAPCESYEYIFQITLDGLYAELDGNVIFIKDIETNQTEYTIPAPYMYDANGNYSYDVSYTLEQIKDEIYLLVVTADAEWINSEERAFPVVVDPTFEHHPIYYDSYVDTRSPDENFGYDPIMKVSNNCAAFIQMPIPDLPEGATLNSAYLNVPYYYYITTGMLSAALYEVNEAWGEGTITANIFPNIGDIISTDMLSASADITEQTPGNARFNITTLINKWYNGTPNYGVMIMRRDSSQATNQSVILKTYEAYAEPTYISVNYTYFLPDGVYAFENASLNDYWISVKDDNCWTGTVMQHEESLVDPTDTDVFDRSRLFKITRIGTTARYTIRSMLNNNLSFNIVGDKIVTKEIPSVDADVPISDTFSFEWRGDGFTIEPYNSSYILSITSFSSADLSYESDTSDSPEARWLFREYTGENRYGVSLFSSKNSYILDETVLFMPAIWSTYIGYNTPRLSVSSIYQPRLTFEWDNTTRTGLATFLEQGSARIDCDIYNDDLSDSYTLLYYFSIIPISEGVYFLKCAYNEGYLQAEESTSNSSLTTKTGALSGEDIQKWEFIYDDSGYYKIISVGYNLALSDQGELSNSTKTLVLENSAENDHQLWKITKSSSGKHIIKPKSSESSTEDWCIALNNLSSGAKPGATAVQRSYTNDTNFRDEWILMRIGYASPVKLEGQQKSNWCWVATARMFAKHYYPSVTYTQEDAVAHIKGNVANTAPGNLEEAQRAINYYISNISGASIDTVIKYKVVYSKETLLRFLNDGHIVYVGRSKYTNVDGSLKASTGHVMLICGYVTIGTEIYFLVRNSSPINEGSTEIIPYNKLYNGNDHIEGEEIYDDKVWDEVLVVETSYSNDTTPFYYNQ